MLAQYDLLNSIVLIDQILQQFLHPHFDLRDELPTLQKLSNLLLV